MRLEREKPPLLVVVGPTAVGKSELAVELALRVRGEVVTADSMQVYRGLDIAAAKPTLQERKGVPHHLIDVCDPDERFNVAEYRRLAHEAIATVHRRGNLPILAGGTGLYVKAVLDEFLFPDEGADYELRRRLEAQAREEGPRALHRRLAEVDPESAARLHPNDVRRVVRALEVYYTTGRPLSEHLKEARASEPAYEVAMFGLTRPREVLYRRINERVDAQIRQGLIEEVRRLAERYGELPVARQALGCKEILAYLKGELTLEEAVERIKRDTRRFAKRQYTWFRKQPRIRWIDLEELGSPAAAARLIAEEIKGSLGWSVESLR